MRSRLGALTPVLGVLIVIAIAAAAYAAQASAEPGAEYAEYRNSDFGFSLAYPADMTVAKNEEAGGAQSITFASAKTGKQFEILAIPYSQVDIAAGAYAPHDAYGTADQGLQLRDVNVVVSDTVQIWFVKLGVMYEVIAFKGGERWLIDILKTWQFD